MHHPTRIPHFLRLTIVLLRIVIGLHFFALGFGRLFHSSLFGDPSADASLAGISAWFASLQDSPLLSGLLTWAILIIGAGLVLGLATRLLSFVGILVSGFAYLHNLSLPTTLLAGVLNNQLVLLISLGILFFSRAGGYLGFDTFFHFSFWRKR